MQSDLPGFSSKTSQGCSTPEITLLDASSLALLERLLSFGLRGGDGPSRALPLDPNMDWHGPSLMPNFTACPNDAKESSLSDILVSTDGEIPPKYYLSQRACAGILRRAAKRGKDLPEELREALEAVATQATEKIRTPM